MKACRLAAKAAQVKSLGLATPLPLDRYVFDRITYPKEPRHFRPHPPEQPGFQVDGQRLTLLDTGPRRLEAVLALIDGAQVSLRILYYIYADDETGRRVRDAMIAAARRGVSVSVIVDGFGAGADEAFFRPLVETGARLSRFEPRFGRRYLLRNHQKLALADAEGPSPRSSSAASILRMIISAPPPTRAGAIWACWSRVRRRRGWRDISMRCSPGRKIPRGAFAT
ncbi:hypothetical protein GCM10020258_19370 [Sphingomonas yabuuchiae]